MTVRAPLTRDLSFVASALRSFSVVGWRGRMRDLSFVALAKKDVGCGMWDAGCRIRDC